MIVLRICNPELYPVVADPTLSFKTEYMFQEDNQDVATHDNKIAQRLRVYSPVMLTNRFKILDSLPQLAVVASEPPDPTLTPPKATTTPTKTASFNAQAQTSSATVTLTIHQTHPSSFKRYRAYQICWLTHFLICLGNIKVNSSSSTRQLTSQECSSNK